MAERERKGKKQHKKSPKMKKGLYYSVSGDKASKKKKECPKCGSGIFLAEHKDRLYCGNCHYTEMKK